MTQETRIEKEPGLVSLSPCLPVSLSFRIGLRAWFYLVWLSWQRLGRFQLMLWIALALLAFSAFLVTLRANSRGWETASQPHPNWWGPTHDQWAILAEPVTTSPERLALGNAVSGSVRAALRMGSDPEAPESSRFSHFAIANFTQWVVFSAFLSFLLPILSLSFATEALGGEREGKSVTWLLSRPLSRPAIYLAKFVAILPWAFGLNLGGFVLLCLVAGRPGWIALQLYWPAVAWATLAFAALFHFIGMYFRWPAVIAIVYTFFLETIMGNMPGYLKRVSVNFYAHCMMYDAAKHYGVQPEKPSIYMPVSGTTAWCVLLVTTVVLLGIGMLVFSRLEYRDA